MFYHQTINSIGNKIYNGYLYRNIFWQLHLHKGYELCFVISGEVTVIVGNTEEKLQKGECLLVPPYRPHGYKGENQSVCFVAVFSGSFVPTFDKLSATRSYLSHKFTPSVELANYFAKNSGFADCDFPPEDTLKEVPSPDELTVKACLYAMVAEFKKHAEYKEGKQETNLISRILLYVEENYTENITLKSLCREIGYNYEYVSKAFHNAMGIPFKTLLNQYRCEKAKELIEIGEKSLSDIAFESGFQCVRNFNRVYKELMGCVPSQKPIK